MKTPDVLTLTVKINRPFGQLLMRVVRIALTWRDLTDSEKADLQRFYYLLTDAFEEID